MTEYLRVTEDDGSQWVNAEAFDELHSALRGLESWITNSSTDTQEGRAAGRKMLIAARAALSKETDRRVALKLRSPYGPMCMDPDSCVLTGRCPRDPVCGN